MPLLRPVRWLPFLLALALASPARASDPSSPQLVQMPGLGPLLLVGPDAQSALGGYVNRLVKHRVFPGASAELRSWGAGLTARPRRAPTLEQLRRTGKPVVGIQLNHLEDLSSSGAPHVARAIKRNGGIPVFLPPGYETARIGQLLGSIDHLVLLGGADVHPKLYGQKVTHARNLKLGRDRYEVKLVQQAMARGMGIDGICRGMQLLNVAAGGTLYQDIHLDGATRQPHKGRNGGYRRQLVRLEGGSRTARAAGATKMWTRSVHHQAVRQLGRDLCVVGRSCDGLPEVIEGFGGRVRGYQFHPERSRSPTNKAIFRDMVRRAARAVKR
jgi:putative glutamine amidotransferase